MLVLVFSGFILVVAMGVQFKPLGAMSRMSMMMWFIPKFISGGLSYWGLGGVKEYYKVTDLS